MRLVSLITKSRDYIERIVREHKAFAAKTYDEQNRVLADDMVGGSEIWSTGLISHGYQTCRIFENVASVQIQWAQEHGIRHDGRTWRELIAAEQIRRWKPEIIIFGNYAACSAEFVRRVRAENPSVRLIIGWCGSPYRETEVFREFDLVLSNVPELVRSFREKGHVCYHLNHAFDPRVLDRIDQRAPPQIDFSFIGSVVRAVGFHRTREALLLDLIASTDIEIFTPLRAVEGLLPIRTMALAIIRRIRSVLASAGFPLKRTGPNAWVGGPRYRAGDFFDRRDADLRLAKRSHPPVYGIAMMQKLRDSKVTLNTHIDASSEGASNMRLFEATGVGACVLTDWKRNLSELFAPEVEVVTYRDSQECIAKVRALLRCERERQTIALAGQRRTLAEHTIHHRAAQLDEIVKQELRKRSLS